MAPPLLLPDETPYGVSAGPWPAEALKSVARDWEITTQIGTSVLPYAILAVPLSIIGLAVVLAVIRAKQDDLPAIVRALFGRPDDDDGGNDPPSLPKP